VLLEGHLDEDVVLAAGIESGLEDVEFGDEGTVAWCEPSAVPALRAAFEAEGLPVSGAGTTMVADVTVRIDDAGEAGRVLRLLDALEDNDDVQEVYANLDVDESLLADIEL
jgi:transcriptional/translational regulatory protein YebC/TACO1